jgi:hypothetical protein
MPTTYTAYRIVNRLNGRIYIGITSGSVRARWYSHVRDAKVAIAPLYQAMRRDGAEHFAIEAIASARSSDAARELERTLIIQHRSRVDDGGYNATSGGEVVGDESRQRMADAHKGKQQSIESRRAMSVAHQGRKYAPRAPEVSDHLSALRRGKKRGPRSTEFCQKLSAMRMGTANPMFDVPSPGRRAVIVGEIGHPSLAQAAQFCGVTVNTIHNWLASGRARYAA